jgi:cell division protein FtsB
MKPLAGRRRTLGRMMTLMAFIVFILIAFLLGLAVSTARRRTALQPHYEAEIARLRGEVDQLTAQMARLSDEQQFMMRLLSEGSPAATAEALPPPPEPENG